MVADHRSYTGGTGRDGLTKAAHPICLNGVAVTTKTRNGLVVVEAEIAQRPPDMTGRHPGDPRQPESVLIEAWSPRASWESDFVLALNGAEATFDKDGFRRFVRGLMELAGISGT